jgi:hypothetical protein
MQNQRDACHVEIYNLQDQLQNLQMQNNYSQYLYQNELARHGDTQQLLNDISGQHEDLTGLHRDLSSVYQELSTVHQAGEAVRSEQARELEEQAIELQAAQDAARQLGDTVSTVVSANDMASEALNVVGNLAELVVRNQYLELTIARLQGQAETPDEESDEEPDGDPQGSICSNEAYGECPRLCSVSGKSGLKLFSFRTNSRADETLSLESVSQSDECSEDHETSSAHRAWTSYRAEYPLADEGDDGVMV